MTLFKPGSILTPDVALTLPVDGDDAIIRKGVTLIATNDNAVEGAGNGHAVTVAGTIHATNGNGVQLGDDASNMGNSLMVKVGGFVGGSTTSFAAGAVIYGSGQVLQNAGTILGAFGVVFGVDAGPQAILTNSGTISGNIGVMRSSSDGIGRLVNTGSIYGVSLSFAGASFGPVIPARDIIINSGLMRGDIDFSAGNDLYEARGKGRVVGTIYGEDGDDVFRPGQRAETFNGGSGNDMLDLSKSTVGINVSLNGTGVNTGITAGDSYTSIEKIKGTAFNDTLRGSSGPETLMGGSGDDRLIGGNGFNHLIGGAGADTISGGSDTDIFYFKSTTDFGDTITNFDGAEDILYLTFNFAGKTGFSPTAAQFRARADNVAQDADDRFIFRTTDKSLWFDADGAGGQAAVLIVDLQQNATLTRDDITYVLT
ncbi:calcium-binding protein [Neogemmobacter tilapiae]|uniref:Calcium-binding protein n=1 Tax=Neogemmobacter tilapiae TaxID=875041 RepID=A0A918TXU1_9RHOB|nr:calcium-binding protein [Gemmobacter tilapiae]GHC66958.1 hypothetical protein GCM10007315_34860 [Gemmobacter tilapiae]